MYYLLNMCSLCLQCDRKLVSLKYFDADIINYYQRIITDNSEPFQISDLPNNQCYICEECCLILDNSYFFWKQCFTNKSMIDLEQTFCSICLCNNDQLNCLKYLSIISFYDKITLGDAETVNTEPSHRKNICRNCYTKLMSLYYFCQRSLRNRNILEGYVKKLLINSKTNEFKEVIVCVEKINLNREQTNMVNKYSSDLDINKNCNINKSLSACLNSVLPEKINNCESIETYLKKDYSSSKKLRKQTFPKQKKSKSNLNFDDQNKEQLINDDMFLQSELIEEKTSENNNSLLNISSREKIRSMLENKGRSETFLNEAELNDSDQVFVKCEDENYENSNDLEAKDDKTEENTGFDYVMPGPSGLVQVQISTEGTNASSTTVNIEDIQDNGEWYIGHSTFSQEAKKIIQCPLCFKTFTTKTSRKQHLLIHAGIRAHACRHCGKTFGTLKVLKQHVRLHTGERPYACPVCLKRFVQLSNLKRHMGTHSDARPYHCKDCDKRFKFLSGFTDHKKKHASDKDLKYYDCAMCPKRFTLYSSFRKHQLKFNHALKVDLEKKTKSNQIQPMSFG